MYLTWSYGKAQLVIGGVYNLFCTQLLASSFSYTVFVYAFMIKVPVYALVLYLFTQFRDRDSVFFYINLGISPKRLQRRVFLVDFLSLTVLLTIVLLCNG